MSPRVSVVIPLFNRPVAVRRAIESVLAQTFQDFEIIVVDDASTDSSAACVARFTDRRIKLIRHERNRGGSAARNTGIHVSSAPHVAFLDSDDEWMPTKLERQLELFERFRDLALVYSGAERVFADGTVTVHIPSSNVDLTRALLTENVIGETSVGMVRRSALEIVGGFDESLPSCQDMDLWLRICERFRADVVPEALVKVTKADDKGRISNNVAHAVRGRALFCQKHREKLIRHGVLHVFLRRSGLLQHRSVRDSRGARRFYMESLSANPIAPYTYVLMLAACLPMSWADAIARCKHFAGRLLRPRIDEYFAENDYRLTARTNLQQNTPNDSEAS